MTQKILKGRPDYYALTEEKISKDDTPLYLMMNLETGCSYHCPKCALSSPRKDMGKPLSDDERQQILIYAKKIGIKSLVIVGSGEPTESKNFSEIIRPLIENAHQEGLITILFTNASHLDREQAVFYRDHNTSIFVSLDSLDPKTYRMITGNGDAENVLNNIRTLREAFRQTQETANQIKVVRLGINTTVVKQNKNELDKIRDFAGEDMQFIANPPLRRGSLSKPKIWDKLVGDDYDELERLAREKSETGGHSSLTKGVCGYFSRGISVDVDGKLLSCAYASETASSLDHALDRISHSDLMGHYLTMRQKYKEFCKKIGRKPSCPLRDPGYSEFIKSIR